MSSIFTDVGNYIDSKSPTTMELLRKCGMDYTVASGRVYASFIPKGCTISPTVGGYSLYDEDSNFIKRIPAKGCEITSLFATYREDTYDLLGVVGNRYEIVQNDEIIDFFLGIINNLGVNENDIEFYKGGTLYKGSQIFLVIKLPDYIVGSDDIARYILFRSSHDGSKSISICFTDMRIACSNMISLVLAGAKNKVSIKHTCNVRQSLCIAKNIIHESTEYSKLVKLSLEHFAIKHITDVELMALTAQLLMSPNQYEYLYDIGFDTNAANPDIISTRLINKYKDVNNTILNHPTQPDDVYTLYGWFNGILAYTNHIQSYKNAEDKFCSVIEGSASKIGQKAFDICCQHSNFKV